MFFIKRENSTKFSAILSRMIGREKSKILLTIGKNNGTHKTRKAQGGKKGAKKKTQNGGFREKRLQYPGNNSKKIQADKKII